MKTTPILLVALNCIPARMAAQSSLQPDAPATVRQRMEASVSRQVASARGIEISIDRQKAAVQRHAPGRAEAFFNLPRPGALPGAPLASCDALPEPEIDSLAKNASRREGVEAELIRDVMKQESAFRPCAVSPKGAMGLMQLMPSTAGDLGVSNPLDPAQNVNAGTRYLRQLMLRYGGDLALTLGAYNAGPARVDSYMAVPEIPETTDYVSGLLSLFTSPAPAIAGDGIAWAPKR